MVPRSDPDAPSLDHGVLRALEALDPALKVTFRNHIIDPLSDETIIVTGGATAENGTLRDLPIPSPCWYLWIKDVGRNHYHLVKEYPMGMGGFDHRHVKALERDVFRGPEGGSMDQRLRTMAEAREGFARDAKQRQMDRKADEVSANTDKIIDTIDGKHKRSATISSYRGQGNRGSRGTITPDTRSAGWEFHDETHHEGGDS